MPTPALADLLTVDRRLIQAEMAKRSLEDFVRLGWKQLEPDTPYSQGWHIGVVCEHLEAVHRGQIRQLIVNVPPGFMKSLLVCGFFPAWLWIHKPALKILSASHNHNLATRDAIRTRQLLESEWYQTLFRPEWTLRDDQNTKARYVNTKAGHRIAVSVGSGTGERGDIRLLDDPHNTSDIKSDTERMNDLEWLKGTWASRGNNPQTDAQILIMQRQHDSDATAYYLEEVGGFQHLCLPMEFDGIRRHTVLGNYDRRTEPNELLWPTRYPRDETERLRRELGSQTFTGQYNQDPVAAGGNIIKTHWLRYWYPADKAPPRPVEVKLEDGTIYQCPQVGLPAEFDEVIQSWDMSLKDKASSDPMVGGVMGRKAGNVFLLDLDRDRSDLAGAIRRVKALTAKWPQAGAKLIENTANGPEVIESLQGQIPGLLPIAARGEKQERLYAVSPFIESGNYYLPHPTLYPWVDAYVSELTRFPAARNDDQVDMTSQGLQRLLVSISRAIPPKTPNIPKIGRRM